MPEIVSTRHIGHIHDAVADTLVSVSVAYIDKDDDTVNDPGIIIMHLEPDFDDEDSESVEWRPEAFLSPGEALMLADRLTRAAKIVLDAIEEGPDLGRELKKSASPG